MKKQEPKRPHWFRRFLCWLCGCRPIVMHRYRNPDTKQVSAVSLFCYRCERVHGWDL